MLYGQFILNFLFALDLLCPPPHPVQFAEIEGLLWSFKESIKFKCTTGLLISILPTVEIKNISVSVTALIFL